MKKKTWGGLHTIAHTRIHTHKQNQQKEGVGFLHNSPGLGGKKKKEQKFFELLRNYTHAHTVNGGGDFL